MESMLRCNCIVSAVREDRGQSTDSRVQITDGNISL